ncbi:hypothetical protein [Photorhabdus kleinii]|nr:hypothetical protein [Photorhabdus kleinii]
MPFINHPEFDDRNIFDITPQISPAKTPLSQEEIQARIAAGNKRRNKKSK